ncbi:energy-coupling factor transporter ATPase [Acidaminobacter hydrogenoformans]|uniref:Energy-coupling factor transporter ATP-binding protein EcfA2 n=1 Tax=Acidaminobacter hydrogenoformans DSM 2784 TaxID=1120920 RepID=A0A1G5S6G3_9FIRM|nr:energy-coupling factor transporter ATPase [Acidaminobacter hydrogenoformans]SCZ81916.1 energy-coupling factor transport system ATP-binding protein [Acidaminobacter hydrogenoformans DSM 2784]
MSIIIENLNHIYDIGSPFETNALNNVSLSIDQGDFVGLIGHTGSGKSTLIQHMNGLLKPTSGKIIINGFDITSSKAKLNEIRKKVGLVFQYPEYQLFEETVEKDVAFGPNNLGIGPEEVAIRVKESLEMVGLDYEEIRSKSPFELSGGQKRRVAIAGVIAMKPEVLILDEPTAGLDPKGRDEILDQILSLHAMQGITVILVSHSMEDIARYVRKIFVMDGGSLVLAGEPAEVFSHVERLEEIGLAAPQVTYVAKALADKGIDIDPTLYTVEGAAARLMDLLRRKSHAS